MVYEQSYDKLGGLQRISENTVMYVYFLLAGFFVVIALLSVDSRI